MKILARHRSEQNAAALDPWSLVHFSAGLALGLMNAPYRTSLLASVGYEIAEQFAERREFGNRLFQMKGPESLPNVFVDLALFYVGLRAGKKWMHPEQK
jgi:hypothetical protein